MREIERQPQLPNLRMSTVLVDEATITEEYLDGLTELQLDPPHDGSLENAIVLNETAWLVGFYNGVKYKLNVTKAWAKSREV